MNLNPLKVFLAIVNAGSQHAAARQLGLTQPAVAKSLKGLEAELGVRLFERSVHGATLTAFGLRLLTHARLIDTELRNCIDALEQLKGQEQGLVSLALSHLPSALLLPSALPAFRSAWPEVRIHVAAGTFPYLLTNLREGALDFAIVPAPAEQWPEDISRLPLMRSRLALIARRSHPQGDCASIKELSGVEWILPTEGSATARALLAAADQAGASRPVFRTTCETLTGTVMAVAATDLIAVVPVEMLDALKRMGDIQQLRIAETLEGAELCLLQRRTHAPGPACQALIDAFTRTAAGLNRPGDQ